MSTRIPMYEGDGYIRSGMSHDEVAPGAAQQESGTPPTVAELARIEREARRLRSEVVGGMIARFFAWASAQYHRANQRALERAIGRPTDPADLERRLRAFERRDRAHA